MLCHHMRTKVLVKFKCNLCCAFQLTHLYVCVFFLSSLLILWAISLLVLFFSSGIMSKLFLEKKNNKIIKTDINVTIWWRRVYFIYIQNCYFGMVLIFFKNFISFPYLYRYYFMSLSFNIFVVNLLYWFLDTMPDDTFDWT